MQEVEDGITGLAALERADRAGAHRGRDARAACSTSPTARYEGGATTYLDVITAQQALLTAERLAAQLAGQRLLTSVFLVKALGGDWDQPAGGRPEVEPGAARPQLAGYRPADAGPMRHLP